MRTHTSQAGIGLIDTMIAVSLLGIVMTSMAVAIGNGQRLFESGMSRSQVEIQMVRTLGRVRSTLYASNKSMVANVAVAPFWTDTIAFERTEGFDHATGRVMTRAATLGLELEEGELDDGVDNDADGLIDEGQVVLTLSPGAADEERVVLCTGVAELLEGELPNGIDDNGNGLIDEAGLAFCREGSDLTVRLCVEGRDREGHLWTRTLDTTVLLRN